MAASLAVPRDKPTSNRRLQSKPSETCGCASNDGQSGGEGRLADDPPRGDRHRALQQRGRTRLQSISAFDAHREWLRLTETRDDGDSGPIVIARRNADASVWRFQAEVMAEVRSVEQQYWNLAQAHVQLWCRRSGRQHGEGSPDRERAEFTTGRGTVADVAEAQQRLEQLELDLVTRTSDVITAERQLRNLLGLPPADNRRIIPVTPTDRGALEPDWDSSLARCSPISPTSSSRGRSSGSPSWGS